MDNAEVKTVLDYGRSILDAEILGLQKLRDGLDSAVVNSVKLIRKCNGKLILTGIGKSGHIAHKIASTFSSTGTPALFMHPSEANHGDLGLIHKFDLVIALSNSGESSELFETLNYCRRLNINVIGITSEKKSTLAKFSKEVLLLPKVKEACPLGLAPTTSTMLMLAMGDLLAMSTLKMKKFSPKDFHSYHPGGKLGQKLLCVSEVMTTNLPLVYSGSSLSESVIKMSENRLGCVGIIDSNKKLIGIFTDGDLRRSFEKANHDKSIDKLMHLNPIRVPPDMLLAELLKIFKKNRIPSIFVCDKNMPVGFVHLHDLLKSEYL